MPANAISVAFVDAAAIQPDTGIGRIHGDAAGGDGRQRVGQGDGGGRTGWEDRRVEGDGVAGCGVAAGTGAACRGRRPPCW